MKKILGLERIKHMSRFVGRYFWDTLYFTMIPRLILETLLESLAQFISLDQESSPGREETHSSSLAPALCLKTRDTVCPLKMVPLHSQLLWSGKEYDFEERKVFHEKYFRAEDAGDFTCQVATKDLMEQTFTIEIKGEWNKIKTEQSSWSLSSAAAHVVVKSSNWNKNHPIFSSPECEDYQQAKVWTIYCWGRGASVTAVSGGCTLYF